MYKWTDNEIWFIKNSDHLTDDFIADLIHKDIEEVKYYRNKFGTEYKKVNSRHYLYPVWSGMKRRCCKKTHKNYKHYGGRGIKVCDRWLNSFDNFIEDMGDRPSPEYQLGRMDNDGDYCPENCRWVTKKENQRNKRNNVCITAFGETKCVVEWVEDDRCKISEYVLRNRLSNHRYKYVSNEIILTKPAKQI